MKPQVFVFGSNERGLHGAGAAATALREYGAVMGQGFGHAGQSFAIPTKDAYLNTLPLEKIQEYVNTFLEFAEKSEGTIFLVTRIGCGLAGYLDKDIAPMFAKAPNNCIFSPIWWELLGPEHRYRRRDEVEIPSEHLK